MHYVTCSWVDVDTRGTVAPIAGQPAPNTLYWRMKAPPAQADVTRIAADVASSFPNELVFVPTTVAVFTWFAVGRFSSGVDLLNTFQAVLGSDGGEDAGHGRSRLVICACTAASLPASLQ